MRTLSIFWVAVVMVFLPPCGGEPVRQQEGMAVFHVSLDGNDAWSGKQPRANRRQTDGPFATISRARDAIRKLKADVRLTQPVTVFIHAGNYRLTEPIVFTPTDSGSSACPITYAAYQDKTVVVSGGRPITGWKPVTVDGKRLWTTELPEVRDGKWYFRELWMNGQRRIRARHPNKGYFQVAEVPDVTPQTPWSTGQTRFRFHTGDLPGRSFPDDAEVVVMTRWVESRLPLVSIDEKERLISFGKRSVFGIEPGDPYYWEHSFEALDVPGEWYLDHKKGVLYYLPMPGEDMRKVQAVAPAQAQLVRLEGKPEAGQFVEHLVFRGLTFSHTEWHFLKPDIGGFSQAAVGVPGAVYGGGVRHCAFEDCTFAHLGNYALELSGGCQQNRIAGCDIFDLGAGGIKLGESIIRSNDAELTHTNEITHCHIHDGGRMFPSAVGIWIGQSFNNRLTQNHIHDFYYTGISVGWTWGYGPSLAKDDIVEFNHIHHIGVRSDGDGPILSDMGGIYTLGIRPGMIIRSNIFHDIAGLRYGGWGIYFDEGSTGILAENNIVYRTTHGGFHQHYGKENIVRNNIFAFGRDQQIQRSRREAHLSFTFERNIVYWDKGPLVNNCWTDDQYKLDHNLYFRTDGQPILFDNWSFAEWQKRGQDVHSLIADPLFVNPERGDFSLKKGSPASRIGFQPIRLSGPDPEKRRRTSRH